MAAATSDPQEQARLARVAHDRNGLWIATSIEILGLIVFVGLFNFLFPSLGANLDGAPLIGLGLLFSLIPAALWLVFFYRRDRLDAEPKQMVFNLFLLGALVTAALRGPILDGAFQIQAWLYSTWWAHLLGGVLVVGMVEQFLIFATVRYAIFKHSEFDERVDGIVYAIAVGLGMATILNFQYVWSHGGVDLGIGSIRMVINALAYASFAGVVGYVLGQGRFEKVPIYYIPAGISVAALFNGLFFYALDRTVAQSLTYNPWGDLIFAGIIAALTAAVLFWLIARANEETLRLAGQTVRDGNIDDSDAHRRRGLPPALVPAIAAQHAAESATVSAAEATALPDDPETDDDTSDKKNTTPKDQVGDQANDQGGVA
ncbi:MAG: PrsW family glutamic-type intramembrane protease [Litorilinea sp.]